jgi:hypothetical protein
MMIIDFWQQASGLFIIVVYELCRSDGDFSPLERSCTDAALCKVIADWRMLPNATLHAS